MTQDQPDTAAVEATGHSTSPAFPPAGWVTNREAAHRLGVGLETLTCVAWKWRPLLRGANRCVRHPVTGGRCNIYPVEAIERIMAAREAAARPAIPEGFVEKDGACRMFGVTRFAWKRWVTEGKLHSVKTIDSPLGGNRKLYAIEDLERLREALFGEDKLYKAADGSYHVPAGLVRRDHAWGMFGVSKPTWERWERQGRITCGERVPGGPKLYKLDDIKRMLMEFGRFAPPYPDPTRPNVYRVPLSGRDIRRREAIVDAEALSLIEGGTCSFSQTGKFRYVAFRSPNNHAVPLRRVILGITDGKAHIGHVNDDPLDCRRENLVVRTVTERMRHNRKRVMIAGRVASSRFKGVHWEKRTKSWRARIQVDGKTRNLGRFGDQIAAAVAYDEAAQQWFGQHAWLNFPDGVDAWVEQERAQWERDDAETAKREAA
jgi:DNA-binding transcriptional MerR regulator